MNSAILVPRGLTITIRSRRLSRIMVARSWPPARAPAAMEFTGETDSLPEGDGFEPSVPRLRRNSARLAAREATRVRNTIVCVDQLEREKAGRSHRLQAASTSSTSIDSPEHGVTGAVFGRDADLDSHPPLRAQSCDPATVRQHLEPNFIFVESASPR